MSPTDKDRVTPPSSSSKVASQPYEVIADADADKEAWLTARKALITATDVPAILGLPQPGSRLDLFYKKRDEIDGRRLPDYVREAGELGHILEDGNAKLFAQKTLRNVFREQKLLRSRTHPWLGCTLDYTQMVLDPKLVTGWKHVGDFSVHPLELKITSVEGKWHELHGPCPEWQIQVTAQCLVTGAPWGSVSALFGVPTFHHRHEDITIDEELADMILMETEHFDHLIRTNTPPKWGEDVETYEVLRRLDERRIKAKSIVELSPELLKVDVALRVLKAKRSAVEANSRELEKQCKELEAKIGTAIGEHDGGSLPNGIVYSFRVIHKSAQAATHYRQLKRIEPTTKPVRGTNEAPVRRRRKK